MNARGYINHPFISSQFLNISEKMMKDTMANMTSQMFLFFIMNSVLGRIPHGIPCHITNYDSRNDVQTQSAMAKDGPFIPPAAMPRNRSTLPASYAKLVPPDIAMLSSDDKSLKEDKLQFIFPISFNLMLFELRITVN